MRTTRLAAGAAALLVAGVLQGCATAPETPVPASKPTSVTDTNESYIPATPAPDPHWHRPVRSRRVQTQEARARPPTRQPSGSSIPVPPKPASSSSLGAFDPS